MISGLPETRASLILRLPDAQDVAAWEELLQIYGPLVFRMARRQGLQPVDAEDLVQVVFTAISRSVSNWLERSDRGMFRAWLLRIARNTAVNFLTRRSLRSIATADEDAARLIDELPAAESPLSAEFDWEYRRQVFHWAANQVKAIVSETTWQSFWMTHMDGQSITEVAKELGISTGTVYVGRSRVMARLKELVKNLTTSPDGSSERARV